MHAFGANLRGFPPKAFPDARKAQIGGVGTQKHFPMQKWLRLAELAPKTTSRCKNGSDWRSWHPKPPP
eukprot:1734309-Alexandrium_andersonii.AAC.1